MTARSRPQMASRCSLHGNSVCDALPQPTLITNAISGGSEEVLLSVLTNFNNTTWADGRTLNFSCPIWGKLDTGYMQKLSKDRIIKKTRIRH